ncbi:PAT complex subunit CCDC47-like isoform X2 [Halichondria panicea]|uniref:PAT complex subunit CCDC47-like isoform X2 n=1 Tax=Halichondria panicea TaxID=6063 RepID=UPI00312B9266
MAVLRLLVLCLLLVTASTAYRDEDFEEFDEDEAEFDFEVSEELDDDEELDTDYEEEGEEELPEEDEDIDGEEFEGAAPSQSRQSPDDLTLSESTGKMKPFWQAYIVELVVVLCMGLYLLNYFIGRARNSSLAYSWLSAHRELLDTNFTLVGDSGEGDDPTEGELVKLADDEYVLWTSGRAHCIGMLTHMKLSPRQDLFSIFSAFLQPNTDSTTVIFQLDENDMDTLIFACGQKRALTKLVKEYEDLSRYSPSIKPMARADGLFQATESGEVAASVLSDRIMTFLSKHSHDILSIHITDQYTGITQDSEDSDTVVVKKPEKRVIVTFAGCSMDNVLMKFSLQLLEHIASIKLSKEGRSKANRNRSKVSASLEKLAHSQRQEAAQHRREDKAKAAKEKMLAETDPDKQRKMEERENKKARKRNQPKVKGMRVAMK